MKKQIQVAMLSINVLCRFGVIFTGIFFLSGCASVLAPEEVGPVGPWQQDIRGLAAYMSADESFWKEGPVEEPINWVGKIFDIEHQLVNLKPGNTIIWLEVPYTKNQTMAGLGPLPVQVVVAPESSLAASIQQKGFRKGKVVNVKGIFKGFAYTGRKFSGNETSVFGQANDAAAVFAMLQKQTENLGGASDPMEKAKSYAKAKGLPLRASGSGRIILPLLEVVPEEINLVK